jgi:hypothetical protein
MAAPVQMPSEVAQRVKAILDADSVALVTEDGMILYGDQKRVPVTPTVCVEAGQTVRELAGIPRRTENNLVCNILVYYAKVDTNQETKLASEQCGEQIAYHLDANPTLELNGDGGIVIHGWVREIDPGYSYKDGTLYHAVRLVWVGKTKTMLGA